MGKSADLVVLALILSALAPPLPAAAGTKYNACAKLTAGEVEAEVHAKVDRTIEQDVVINNGPYTGETQSSCTWVFAGGVASVAIIRAPRTPQERDYGLAQLRGAADRLKQQGWTVESTQTGGASCTRMVPPASETTARPSTGCFMESKGLAFSVTVVGPAAVTARQVAALAGKVAARLP
ncbi:MAG: hypothetical protein QN141_01885 [Armatimonadota bacterium]|nr:hypothetical protein [Armatimonadota bacterium]MDR7466009.1 hypothetical protein [Armatimonadota bacterium]MDR7494074.1 hypothetical protein [Armatimonadota bacterium]MDR7504059.1 hypothetical protein [Armatimonadota bacterium]MDR7546258.1 hypothetical protein [Armatimonadota bacterium]